MTHEVAVVGGGIAGLAAAWEFCRDPAVDHVTLFEADHRVGGKLRTSNFGGRPVDEGADAFLVRRPEAVALARELGLADRFVSPSSRSALVVARGEVRRLPDGLVLGVPTRLGPLARSGIISPAGMFRAGLDLVRPDDWPGGDEAVAATITRRMGREITDYLVDPLIGSINAADTERLSVTQAAPQLAEAARRHRSLIKGLRTQRSTAASADPDAPLFHGFEGGMGWFAAQVREALVARGVEIRTGAAVRSLRLDGRRVRLDGPEVDHVVDGAVLATPAAVTAPLLAPESRPTSELVGSLETAGVVLVTLALRRQDVAHPLDASGMLVPRPERRLITAASFGSTKWPHWSPDPHRVLLRVSAGRQGDQRALDLDDDDLLRVMLDELDDLLGIGGDVLEYRVSRWPDSFPQYAPGHPTRRELIERELRRDLPMVGLAGSAYRGVGIPACIGSGRSAAGQVLATLAERP